MISCVKSFTDAINNECDIDANDNDNDYFMHCYEFI